jgi:hypothetical protein
MDQKPEVHVEFGILHDKEHCDSNQVCSIVRIKKSLKLYGFDKGWDWEYEKGIPMIFRKIIGKGWDSIT